MKPTSIIYRTLCTMLLAASLAACDNIDEADRYIEAEVPETGRNVLVEEYTGQYCVNCPDGHDVIRKIKGLYGDKVVAVGIHSGMLAFDDPDYGLKTPDGDIYERPWGVKEYPSIVVNRQGAALNNMSEWQAAVQGFMGQVSNVDMEVSAVLDAESGIISINTRALSSQSFSATYQAWIIENGIKAFQMTLEEPGYVVDYVHNHVYRAAANGVEGETVTLSENVYGSMSSKIALDEHWNPDSLHAVVILSDRTGVIQVEEEKIIKSK